MRKKIVASSMFLGLVSAMPAHALISVDDFTTAFDPEVLGPLSSFFGPSQVNTSIQSSADFVGTRTATITATGTTDNLGILLDNTVDASGGVVPSPGNGALSYAGDTGSSFSLSYDVTGLDLTAGGGAKFAFNLSGDLDSRSPPVSVPFNVFLEDENSVTDDTDISLSAEGPYELAFTDFTGVDLTSISTLTFTLQNSAFGTDLTFGAIEILPEDGSSPVVPLPAAAWLLGAGFLGYLGIGRLGRREEKPDSA